jgi:uncharacterized protein (TIGR02996 family)
MKHAFHVQITVAQKTMTFGFKKPAIRIGRLPDNDLVLPDTSVEDHYALVELIHGVRDGFRLRPFAGREQHVPNGDSVAVGRYALTIVSGEAPGEREEEFLNHLIANPSDDTTRMVYSDWLEENGRTEAADFVRAQLKLATALPDTEEFHTAKHTLHLLADLFPSHWRRTIARPPIENCDVRFELQCPKQWGQLTPTNDPTQRFCGTCQRNVHYAPTVDKARSLALAGQCVVVDVGQYRRKNDLEEEERYMMAGMIAPPSRY